jgi:hypothetical protein
MLCKPTSKDQILDSFLKYKLSMMYPNCSATLPATLVPETNLILPLYICIDVSNKDFPVGCTSHHLEIAIHSLDIL